MVRLFWKGPDLSRFGLHRAAVECGFSVVECLEHEEIVGVCSSGKRP
ncbi:hypothetical protein TRIP_B330203 [uncultured Desulfatiglans sp.]|nr:hypothetical protein TRIP_B330203 [uncultured Desulfatiglans sp.]